MRGASAAVFKAPRGSNQKPTYVAGLPARSWRLLVKVGEPPPAKRASLRPTPAVSLRVAGPEKPNCVRLKPWLSGVVLIPRRSYVGSLGPQVAHRRWWNMKRGEALIHTSPDVQSGRLAGLEMGVNLYRHRVGCRRRLRSWLRRQVSPRDVELKGGARPPLRTYRRRFSRRGLMREIWRL